jgi:hypothetical protein
MEWWNWVLLGYVTVGACLTILRTANPALQYRWMAERGASWWNGFVAQAVGWPLFVIRHDKGRWSGRRPFNWASLIGYTLLPKRTIWVNAMHAFHRNGHFRFEAFVPVMDIQHYAENGELYALVSDTPDFVGCTHARPANDDWIDADDLRKKSPKVEWYMFISKRQFDKFLADFDKDALDDSCSFADLRERTVQLLRKGITAKDAEQAPD